MIEVIVTKVVAYQHGERVFTVECFDDETAKIDIREVINVARWDEIAPLIRQCLVDMKLEGDIK